MMNAVDVAIVGGGAAGIAAARALSRGGIGALILEAAPRLGGRACTVGMAGYPLDLGCGWLHSAGRNPLRTIAEEQGFTIDRGRAPWGRQARNLGFPPAEQRAARAAYEAFEQRLFEHPPATDRASDALDPDEPWNSYIEAISGYTNGVGTSALSAADYVRYTEASTDDNWRVREGLGRTVAGAAAPIRSRCFEPVAAIEHGDAGVTIVSAGGSIRARAAIVAVSSNVLASGSIRFQPAIDDRLHAAANLPLGRAEKIFFSVSNSEDLPLEGHLIGNPRRAATGSYHLRPFGLPIIEGLFGGAGAEIIEGGGEAAAYAFATDELAGLLGSSFRQRLRPLATSAWAADPLVRGAYSHACPGSADRRRLLAQPVGRLFFAGEATSLEDFSTVHGAWLSGERAAGEIIRLAT